MFPNVDETPFEGAFDGRIVYDLVYNPLETRLLKEAAAAGCETIGGLDMLVAQAEDQSEWWLGRRPPSGTDATRRRWRRYETDILRDVHRARAAQHVRAGGEGARRRPADACLRVPAHRRALRLRLPARERRRRRARRPLFLSRQGSRSSCCARAMARPSSRRRA